MSQQSTQDVSIEEIFNAEEKKMEEIKEGNITFANCDVIKATNLKEVPKAELFAFVQRYEPFGIAHTYQSLLNSLQYNKWIMGNAEKTKEEKVEALKNCLILIQKLKKTGAAIKMEDRKAYQKDMKAINNAWKLKVFKKGKQVDTPDWLKDEKKPKKN